MAKRNRCLALVMAAAILFAMLASAFFIAEEAGHSCIGDGCSICCQISACRAVLRGLGLVMLAAVLTAAASHALGFCAAVCRVSAQHCTLVSLKVKLSD